MKDASHTPHSGNRYMAENGMDPTGLAARRYASTGFDILFQH